ncbi:hypothetical protein LTR62_007748 [Meristemomyces frigidus]|uniref:Uncharacterized protein n=1 Tax=Meristemomyces frigidus TaxID=1508187 RepID=A0AAN7TBB8_9PEZI|nr:hypothetical protein LTR62_007748 [Meristemomyces frigidus]
MTSRPSSPTSLLWSHQMKRENAYILERIRQMETENYQRDTRLREVGQEAMTLATEEIAAVAEQVKAIDPTAIKQNFVRIENDVVARLGEVQTGSEATMVKVASLEKDSEFIAAERAKAATKERSLLKRVAEVEENLTTYQLSLEQVGQRIDERKLTTIKQRLDSLANQVNKEGTQMKRMEESITALEATNAELLKANEGLAEEIKQMASARSTTKASKKRTILEAESHDDDDDASDMVQPRKRQEKSHKWIGGDADRDIIHNATEHVMPPPSSTKPGKSTSKPAPKLAKKPPPPLSKSIKKLTPAAKRQAKAAPPESQAAKTSAPSRKQLAANFSAVAAAVNTKPLKRGQATKLPQTKPASKPPPQPAPKKQNEKFFQGQADKPIIRAGKGWVEYAVTPSQESPEPSVVENPAGGRPRRSLLARQQVDRTSRRSRADKAPAAAPRRSIEQGEEEVITSPPPKTMATEAVNMEPALPAPVPPPTQLLEGRRIIQQEDNREALRLYVTGGGV